MTILVLVLIYLAYFCVLAGLKHGRVKEVLDALYN